MRLPFDGSHVASTELAKARFPRPVATAQTKPRVGSIRGSVADDGAMASAACRFARSRAQSWRTVKASLSLLSLCTTARRGPRFRPPLIGPCCESCFTSGKPLNEDAFTQGA